MNAPSLRARACALSGFVLPWPLSSLLRIALLPAPPADAPPPAVRFAEAPVMATFHEHAALIVGAAWKVLFAAAAYHAAPWHSAAFSASAAVLAPQWLAAVVVRNVCVTWAVGALWTWLHHAPASPLYARLQLVKFKPEAPKTRQLVHDLMWATCSAVVAAVWEIAIAHAWAVGAVLPRPAVLPGDAWWADPKTLFLLLVLPYFQIIHFYFTHRFMHAWFSPSAPRRGIAALVPDVGAWLYKHVHALHHQSRDPTTLSGTSMHPVESAIFFTTMPLLAAVGAHPIVVLHASFYNIVVAMLGHESFGDPSTGGFSHWLHHQLVRCNYGGTFVPLDHWMGTYARDEDDFVQRFGKQPAAAKATGSEEVHAKAA